MEKGILFGDKKGITRYATAAYANPLGFDRKIRTAFVGDKNGKAKICFGVQPIVVYIDNARYIVDKGTTWGEWANNNSPFAVVAEQISKDGGTTFICNSDDTRVYATDEMLRDGIYASSCEHSAWGEWVITKEPTCIEDGLKERTCSSCGEVQTQVVPASEEYHNYEYYGSQSATCTADGYTKYKCSHCGDIKTTWYDALGHNYDSNGVCTECNHCKHISTNCRKIDSETHEEYCTQCGEVLSTSAHSFDSYGDCEHCGYSVPTGGGGSNTVICPICGGSYNYADYTICPHCGGVEPDKVTCSNCGGTYYKNEYSSCPHCGE
ncbi:MAG: hypothetical protein IKB02_05440 [Clostridia bacterium]|nr:hypothetical protein [Clostridia bacterium]